MTSRLPRLAALLLAAAPLAAQQTTPRAPGVGGFRFTIDNIMRGPELFGREPQNVRWSSDGQWIYFSWLEPGAPWREPARSFRVRAVAGAKPERVSALQMDSAAASVATGRPSPDRKWRAVSSNGDLYLVDANRGAVKRLTETSAAETDPSFSADGKQLYYIRDGNVFALTLDGGLTRQLTDIRAGGATAASTAAGPLGLAGLRGGGGGGGRGQGGAQGGQGAAATTQRGDSTARRNGQRTTMQAEQRLLLEAVRDKLWQDSVAAAERDEIKPALKALTLLPNERAFGVGVAPTGSALVVATNIPAEGAQSTVVPNYVTASGYVEEIPGRTKVGDVQGSGRLLFATLPNGTLKPLRVAPSDGTGPSSQANVIGWNESGTLALVMANTRDFKRRYLATVSADSGAVQVLDVLTDTAWVGGPCGRCAGWYEGGKRVWFVSEADGYAHLYAMAADGTDRQQLTQGKFEVSAVTLSRDGRTFYLTTSEGSAYEQHAWRMAVTGGARTRLTTRVGSHAVIASPDETMLADVFSEANRPPELFIMPNKAGAAESQLTVSPTAEWLAQPWLKPEIVTVPASDGVQVPARIYRPKDLGATPNGAAVIFVHGAGYLHNVHNYWSSYSREYMFNQYLAAKGYVVLDIDYRGSAGYGRDWRTAIYRFMGGRDLQDHVDGVKYLQQTAGIDPKRVGIYGGSYGGFMTLMALFTAPDYFGAGAALRSVTNWAHYNHGYTGAILNLPQDDTLAYHRSSPIYFAQGLKAPLLMAHGMVDTNVNFQDIVELTERLIELGKTNWSLAPYPVEDHGFVRPSSWSDEYRRIDELFDRVLVQPFGGASAPVQSTR